MKNTSSSIPIKVFIGFLLLALFGGSTIWFIYNKVLELDSTEETRLSNKKRALFTEAATRIYTTEGLSRDIIQSKDTLGLANFHKSIDTINIVLKSLQDHYPEESKRYELDSLESLLLMKEENLSDLLTFRALNSDQNYYQRVLKRIEQKDYLEENDNYEQMISSLNPNQQQIIIGYLNYEEQDRISNLADRTADSLINTVKQVLLSLELKEQQYRENLAERENLLLTNDLELSERLSVIRNRIEQEELKDSMTRVKKAQESVSQTSKGVIAFGIIGVLTIVFFLIIIIRDVKESQRNKEALEEAKILAEKLLQSRESIMATVTHDLRSPINSILGYTDLLNRTTTSSKQKNYLKQLQKSSAYTIRLVNDLLDFSKLESGKIRLEKLPFSPVELIEDCVSSNIPVPDPKELKVTVDFTEELEEYYLTDPFRLKQILSNLIGNAYKFTEEGEILLQGKLLKGKSGFTLQIKISDTGIGISEEAQQDIFEAFSQEKTDAETQQKGFGLGLAISKRLTELLGGTLTLKSQLNKGSEFTIQIPVEKSEVKGDSLTEIEWRIKDSEGKRLLVVDDDEIQLSLITEIFEDQGFKVVKAKNGEEGLQYFKAGSFSAVFTDIQMPKMDGIALLKCIRKENDGLKLPVVALSGGTQKPKSFYKKEGFTEYLIKPYKREELILLTAEVLYLKTEKGVKTSKNEKDNSSELYDLSDLKSFIGEDPDTLEEIIQSMVESSQASLVALGEAFKNEDREKISAMAHKMLPMLRQINATTTFKSLEILENENLAETEKTTVLEKHFEEAKIAVNNVLEELVEKETKG